MTSPTFLGVAGYLWIGWGAYWFYSSRKVKAEIYRQDQNERLLHKGQLILSFLLLFAGRLYLGPFTYQILPHNAFTGVTGNLITLFGIAFMIWARIYLGSNWSATVTLKKDHELIQSGPYALTRHPIYTGFILAAIGTAIIVGEVRGILAVIILFYSFSAKLRLEEAVLKKQFPDAYRDYESRVKRIVPFLF
jgi:protein-S-isoprenylcysteine O-methyltransferase Ste14